jgi:hypothetical protein
MASSKEDQLKLVHTKIDDIFNKYENDDYMFTRAFNYINQFQNILNNIQIDHEYRTQRMEELTADQDVFIQSFMMINNYFYCQTTETFFAYDGLHFKMIVEDDIIHHILTTIRNDKQLLCWKERTRIYIMKRIKENNILNCVPESETIQYVLDSLYPSIFETKSEAKYFLCLLGDCIFKKNTDLIHFVNPKAKNFIRELNGVCQMLIGTNLSNTIKHKYYEHEYSNCRLLNINDSIASDNICNFVITNVALDLICVACHYSIRYNNSDEYLLQSCNDPFLTEKIFYLKTTNHQVLVSLFVNDFLKIRKGTRSRSWEAENSIVTGDICEEDIEPNNNITNSIATATTATTTTNTTTQITWRDMQYLWKQFLDSKQLPQIMFMSTLKSILISQLSDYYKETLDSFVGITCVHLPGIRRFLSFWESNMIIDSEKGMQYEISEICSLIKKWNSTNDENITNGCRNTNDKQLLDLIFYFYPNISIEGQKYIYEVKCILWDKREDIILAIAKLKEDFSDKYKNGRVAFTGNMLITIYHAYKYYCKFAIEYHAGHEKIVSKSFFENFLLDYLRNYIVDDNYISVDWIL